MATTARSFGDRVNSQTSVGKRVPESPLNTEYECAARVGGKSDTVKRIFLKTLLKVLAFKALAETKLAILRELCR